MILHSWNVYERNMTICPRCTIEAADKQLAEMMAFEKFGRPMAIDLVRPTDVCGD